MKSDLHAVKEDVSLLKVVVRSHTDAIRAQGESINSLKEVVQGHTKAIQGNTEAIRSMQADLKSINQRLEVVEAKS